MIIKKVKAEEIETKKLKVGAQEKPEGITIYDEDTHQPLCVKAKSGALNATSGECGN